MILVLCLPGWWGRAVPGVPGGCGDRDFSQEGMFTSAHQLSSSLSPAESMPWLLRAASSPRHQHLQNPTESVQGSIQKQVFPLNEVWGLGVPWRSRRTDPCPLSFTGMVWLLLIPLCLSLLGSREIWEGGGTTTALGAARASCVAPAPCEQWLCLGSPVPCPCGPCGDTGGGTRLLQQWRGQKPSD